MPPINITPLAGVGDQARQQTSDDRAAQPITGKVYALKDGSGYAALASDGSYYRVDIGNGHGLIFSRTGGFVDAAMVDVVHGPVKSVEARSDRDTHAGPHDDGIELHLSVSGARPDDASPSAQHPALKDSGHAAVSSREAHTLIVQKPGAAVDSQANLSAQNVLSLLD
ncbi:MAG TPA: hypothetical protein VIM92_09160 [Rhodanobacteraceae bacterium]